MAGKRYRSLLKVTAVPAMLLGIPQMANADHYKCFVETDNGRYHILYIDTDSAELARQIAADSRVEDSYGVEMRVHTVLECILKEERFRFSFARRLETKIAPN